MNEAALHVVTRVVVGIVRAAFEEASPLSARHVLKALLGPKNELEVAHVAPRCVRSPWSGSRRSLAYVP